MNTRAGKVLGAALLLAAATPASARSPMTLWEFFSEAERQSWIAAEQRAGVPAGTMQTRFENMPVPALQPIREAAARGIENGLVQDGICENPRASADDDVAVLLNDGIVALQTASGRIAGGYLVGAWVQGCDGFDRASIAVIATPAGLQPVLPLPGTSESWLSLRLDMARKADLAVRAANVQQCLAAPAPDRLRVLGTRLVDGTGLGTPVHGGYLEGRWTETRRVALCGGTFDVPFELSADGNGGAYITVPAIAVRQPAADRPAD